MLIRCADEAKANASFIYTTDGFCYMRLAEANACFNDKIGPHQLKIHPSLPAFDGGNILCCYVSNVCTEENESLLKHCKQFYYQLTNCPSGAAWVNWVLLFSCTSVVLQSCKRQYFLTVTLRRLWNNIRNMASVWMLLSCDEATFIIFICAIICVTITSEGNHLFNLKLDFLETRYCIRGSNDVFVAQDLFSALLWLLLTQLQFHKRKQKLSWAFMSRTVVKRCLCFLITSLHWSGELGLSAAWLSDLHPSHC